MRGAGDDKAALPGRVLRFGARDVTCLLGDAGTVRHCDKIDSTINKRPSRLEVLGELRSLAAYVLRSEPPPSDRSGRSGSPHAALRKLTESAASRALSKDLKRRSWTFVGPTTEYAFMQQMSPVDDHL